jgi:hypothetical protein
MVNAATFSQSPQDFKTRPRSGEDFFRKTAVYCDKRYGAEAADYELNTDEEMEPDANCANEREFREGKFS